MFNSLRAFRRRTLRAALSTNLGTGLGVRLRRGIQCWIIGLPLLRPFGPYTPIEEDLRICAAIPKVFQEWLRLGCPEQPSIGQLLARELAPVARESKPRLQ